MVDLESTGHRRPVPRGPPRPARTRRARRWGRPSAPPDWSGRRDPPAPRPDGPGRPAPPPASTGVPRPGDPDLPAGEPGPRGRRRPSPRRRRPTGPCRGGRPPGTGTQRSGVNEVTVIPPRKKSARPTLSSSRSSSSFHTSPNSRATDEGSPVCTEDSTTSPRIRCRASICHPWSRSAARSAEQVWSIRSTHVGQRAGGGSVGGQSGQASHDGGQAADGLDVLPLHAVRGDIADGKSEVLIEDGRADEQAVHRCRPRVGDHRAGEAQTLPLGRVEAPPHVGGLHPLPDHRQLVVVEPESLTDRAEGQELQHGVGVESTSHQWEQGRRRAQHRIGGPDGAVGEPVAERGCTGSVDLGDHGRREGGVRRGRRRGCGRPAERRLDQGGEAVEGRAQHHDVVLGEVRPRSGEQVEQGVPQDLDLAGGAEAGVELDRVVCRVVAQRGFGSAVGPEVVLQAAEEGVGAGPRPTPRFRAGAAGRPSSLDVGQL